MSDLADLADLAASKIAITSTNKNSCTHLQRLGLDLQGYAPRGRSNVDTTLGKFPSKCSKDWVGVRRSTSSFYVDPVQS